MVGSDTGICKLLAEMGTKVKQKYCMSICVLCLFLLLLSAIDGYAVTEISIYGFRAEITTPEAIGDEVNNASGTVYLPEALGSWPIGFANVSPTRVQDEGGELRECTDNP